MWRTHGSGGVKRSSRGYDCRLLKTGQTTQYSSELDDGYYQKGVTKRYTVLSTGGFSGTTNIDLAHYSAATISFAATTPGTINDSANGLVNFLTGDVIIITGSGLNNGTYNISTGGVAGTIRTTEATVLEAAGATVVIAKREGHSNNVVIDEETGLWWSRYVSDKMGTASDGKMPWTGQLYDIFAYCAAANVALLGGYGDWRISNREEFGSIVDISINSPAINTTAFPSFPSDRVWTSSTPNRLALVTYGYNLSSQDGLMEVQLKTEVYYVLLVRGG